MIVNVIINATSYAKS